MIGWIILGVLSVLALVSTIWALIYWVEIPNAPLPPGQRVADYGGVFLGAFVLGCASVLLWLLFGAVLVLVL